LIRRRNRNDLRESGKLIDRICAVQCRQARRAEVSFARVAVGNAMKNL